MKVGTDGVLIGAWANVQSAKTFCDIGTGTGLIAIMLAQRTLNANIFGVELDEIAVKDATFNFENSPWSNRLSLIQEDFKVVDFDDKIEHFVSNPPYFNATSAPIDASRKRARHEGDLDLDTLMKKCKELGHVKHKLSLILPSNLLSHVKFLAFENGYTLTRLRQVLPTPKKEAKRILVELQNFYGELKLEEDLVIEYSRHHYTDDYKALTSQFYLKM